MKAAIYARKSNDDNEKTEDNKSVTRQKDHAKAYAKAKGWTVDPEHVFEDDGISGARFDRPGLVRMLNSLKQFDVIVMSELSRLGREQSQTNIILHELSNKDKQMWFYLTDEELKFETALDKFMVSAISFGAELEKEKGAQRSRDGGRRKAEAGHCAGGACYGYDLVPVYGKSSADGEPVKSHTEYRIDKAEADIVRRIFRMYADGWGLVTIAKTLNGEDGVAYRNYPKLSRKYFVARTPPAPLRGDRGTGSWSPSLIREMLHRERYCGRVQYGKWRKKANRKRVRGEESLLIDVDMPALRIVPEDLWTQVQARLKTVRESYLRNAGGKLWGRPAAAKYLLSGLGQCEPCGGGIVVMSTTSGPPGKRRSERILTYGCMRHHKRGRKVCQNDHRVRMEDVDTPLLDTIDQTVLRPSADWVIERVMQTLAERRRQNPNRQQELKKEIKAAERKLDNLLQVAGEGRDEPKSVREKIRQCEQQLDRLNADLAAYQVPVDMSELDERRLRKEIEVEVGRFRDVMHSDAQRARQALRKLLVGRIHFVPAVVEGRKTYYLEGQTTLGPLVGPGLSNTFGVPKGMRAYSGITSCLQT